jgi:hypothetical protein
MEKSRGEVKKIDNKNMADIYAESVLMEMSVSTVVGGSGGVVDQIENVDGYAPDDNRIVKVLGATQTRNGQMGTSKGGKIKNLLKSSGKSQKTRRKV